MVKIIWDRRWNALLEWWDQLCRYSAIVCRDGMVAYENLRSLPVGLVGYRRSSHLLRTFALPIIYFNLPLLSYRLGTTPSYSFTF